MSVKLNGLVVTSSLLALFAVNGEAFGQIQKTPFVLESVALCEKGCIFVDTSCVRDPVRSPVTVPYQKLTKGTFRFYARHDAAMALAMKATRSSKSFFLRARESHDKFMPQAA